MCISCEREQAAREAAEAERIAALKAAEPKRELKLAEILRGDPCYTYSSRARERFEEAGSVMVSVSLAVEQAADWDWYWAASRLLTEAGYAKFSEAANAAYKVLRDAKRPYQDLLEAATNIAMREYNRAKDEVLNAGGDYNAAYDAGDKAYEAASEVERAAIKAVSEVLDTRTNQAYAKAFAEIYISEEGTTDRTGNDRYYNYDQDEDYSDYDDEDEDY